MRIGRILFICASMRIIQKESIFLASEPNKVSKTESVLENHLIGKVISGTLIFTNSEETIHINEGEIYIFKKNQIRKTTKLPTVDGRPFESIGISLIQEDIKSYMIENRISSNQNKTIKRALRIENSESWNNFFDSIKILIKNSSINSTNLIKIKVKECIGLISQTQKEATQFLFDLSESNRADLGDFMRRNFLFHLPISDFAKMSGRSLSTFKRDFKKIFTETPEQWLKNRRLEYAYKIITEKKLRPSDAYYEAGFENFSHFSNAFKIKFGKNASELYKEIKKN